MFASGFRGGRTTVPFRPGAIATGERAMSPERIDEAAPHVHVLAVPRPEGGNGRVGWCATRDQAVSRICAGGRAGSKYRMLQDDFHAQVSQRFGLGRAVVADVDWESEVAR